MTTHTVAQDAPARIAWPRVARFYGIAFGGAVLVAVLLWLAGRFAGPAAPLIVLVGAAVLYMPLPIVAGLLVERRDGRRPLIAEEWQRLRSRFWATVGRSAGWAMLAMGVILVLGLLVAWLAGWAGLPGAGHFVASEEEFRARLMEVTPGVTASTPLPPVAVVATVGLVQGLLAGLTINAVFAFGEEYGWRGVLARELEPLGVVRSNLLIGVLWGLWHAPIIMLGHNYGAEWGWGIPMMVLWTIPLSFVLTWVRQRSGSVLAPAFLHGAYNGTSGFFTLVMIGGNVFVAVPMGALMVLVLTVTALVVWRWPARPAPAAADHS